MLFLARRSALRGAFFVAVNYRVLKLVESEKNNSDASRRNIQKSLSLFSYCFSKCCRAFVLVVCAGTTLRGAPCHTLLKHLCVPMKVWDVSRGLNTAKRDDNPLTACLQDGSPRCHRLHLMCGNVSHGKPVGCEMIMSGENTRRLSLLLWSAQERCVLTTRLRTSHALR